MDDPLASPLSRSSLDMEHDSIDAGMPMMEGMDHGGHAEGEQMVELAHHEIVSTSQKGYSLAVAITLLSGLVFGVMVFKKPGE
jgi:LDH2 family malate/lactate/ureidoglycolate dehydrogenase